ncbi:hypothetical protein LTR36_006698 [Oleoguttula mirabilis]|uniref:Uncharacterized protein n=1 Tax=Oleoguttula mirabilis TaxID=1507867 RepID=A0AAV9JBA6_9PEZI|nr:hypothetical protein LTR36_006698 [Oleoguttula mirabilis]
MEGTLPNATSPFLAGSSNTTGTQSSSHDIIVCHQGWFVALTIASTVMVLAGLSHPLVGCYLSQAPDIMLNISSLATKYNPYIAVPSSGTLLAASERAKLLTNLKVRYGDVEASADVGRLAIASFDGAQSVRKGRLYM